MSSQAWDYAVTISLVNILLYIAISEISIDNLILPFFSKKKYTLSILISFITFLINGSIILIGLWQTIEYNSKAENSFPIWSQTILIYIIYFTSFAFLSFGIATRLIFQWVQSQQKMNDLEKERSRTELEFLKAQVNPHTLFNYLNSIYSLIDKKNAEARKAVSGFSEIMRYQLYECSGDEIPIEDEIRFLKGFIDLQRTRKDTELDVHLEIDTSVADFKIHPMIMVPFVENAFKYVKNVNGKGGRICIRLSKVSNKFIFRISNTFSTSIMDEKKISSGGLGITNTKKRLNLYYPNQHQLNISCTKDLYEVHLEIDKL
jgi:LytS/YehU family sensor histidine kinase